jgi:hypothetical protein
MNLNLALGRGHLLRPFLAVLAVFLGQIVVVIWSQLPALGDQGPAFHASGSTTAAVATRPWAAGPS